MSLLNLNSPAGQSPRGKKSLKMWMGAGLVVAVLGLGSTFAANITLNSPEGTSEFGQGVTQTVYCGGDQTVTVSPTSTFKNTTPKFKLVTPYSGSKSVPTWAQSRKQIIYAKDSSSFPKFLSRATNASGWWIKNSNATTQIDSQIPVDYPANAAEAISAGTWSFVEEVSSNTYKTGEYSTSYTEPLVSLSNGAASFTLGGIVISKIPTDCSGVNFVVTSYGATNNSGAQDLVSGASLVAAKWTGSGSVTPSKSRKCSSSVSGITATQTSSSLEFTITGSTTSATDVTKIVVETQEDALSATCQIS